MGELDNSLHIKLRGFGIGGKTPGEGFPKTKGPVPREGARKDVETTMFSGILYTLYGPTIKDDPL